MRLDEEKRYVWGPFQAWYRSADEWNPTDFGIQGWARVTVDTAVSPSIGLLVDLEPSEGRVQLKLPYLHVRLRLWGDGMRQWFWRIGRERPRETGVVRHKPN